MKEILELGEEAEEGMAELDHAAGPSGGPGVTLVVYFDNADVEPLVLEDRDEVADE